MEYKNISISLANVEHKKLQKTLGVKSTVEESDNVLSFT